MDEVLRDRWVVIRNSRGLRLAAELRLPAGSGPYPAVAFAHGRGSMQSDRHRVTAEALRSAGIATLLFDFTGHGDSEGDSARCTGNEQVSDLHAVIAYLQHSELVGGKPIGILGGNSVAPSALIVAADSPGIRALVLKAGKVAGAEALAGAVTAPTLLVVGERDAHVLAENCALLPHLPGRSQLAVIPDADHLLDDDAARQLASARIADWFARHLSGAAFPTPVRKPLAIAGRASGPPRIVGALHAAEPRCMATV